MSRLEAGGRRSRRRWAAIVATIALAASLAGFSVGVAVERSSGEVSVVSDETGAAGAPAAAGTVARVAAAAASGVVSILATKTVSGPPLPPGASQEAVAEGAGLVLDTKGHILTAQHVIASASKIHVSFGDGTKVHASVLGSDPFYDLAVIEVKVEAATLHPLALGSSAGLGLGDTVIAIGNPFELDRSISLGVVSGLRRQITAPNGFALSNAVQTDAAINHGNSGGPLLDARGRVVGVNVQIADSGVDANVGVGFAVGIDAAVRRDIAELLASRPVEHSWLGVALDDIDAILATSGRVEATEGALVTGVVAGGPAARAGVRGGSATTAIDGLRYCLGGDVVTAVDGRRVSGTGDLEAALAARKPGERLTLSVVRSDGSTKRLAITLVRQPTSVPEVTSGCR